MSSAGLHVSNSEINDTLGFFIQSTSVVNRGLSPIRSLKSSKFAVGQRIEALLGTKVSNNRITGGIVLGILKDGSYAVIFDTGDEFESLDESLLSREIDRVAELETQLAQVRWRKVQNESQIKNVLESSRVLQEQELRRQLERNIKKEKDEWVRLVF
jgi:hypothetical protein